MSDATPAVQYREIYSKPSTFEDGRPCIVWCNKDDPEATACEISIRFRGYDREIRFVKNSFTGHNDRGQYQREGEWPLEMGRLAGMLQAAFEQGIGHQRKATRDLFEKVMGIS